MEDLQQQMNAHRITIESVKEQAERSRNADLKALRDKHRMEQGGSDKVTTNLHADNCIIHRI